jgi:carbonic anhydrase
MKKAIAVFILVLFSFAVFAGQGKTIARTSADKALSMLEKGNKRYYTGKMRNKYRGKTRRKLSAKAQKPFAVILSCSDSRVPPEIIFDQGLGDLFVIRTAGNISDDVVLGSIEYAVEHLGVKLIVVLGHERCGAVTALVEDSEAPGHIKSIIEKLGACAARAQHEKGDLLDNAIMINITTVVKELCNSEPILKEKVRSGALKIAGAYYDLDSGKVMGVRE